MASQTGAAFKIEVGPVGFELMGAEAPPTTTCSQGRHQA